ncbi:hypothetical protein Vafri_3149 [Volvox africanus]|uniref:Uncharacterized protein n=1 Tax=Volvox africanus TaxID=51714 RepID=A0A8J4AQW2_9CHLO|nr:hypothetical protein Vafri_3149 [Volvox africanus]
MDIVLRRCSPLTKQPEHRGRTHIVAAAETSSRPAEAALELDSSPHDVMRDGEDGHQRNEPRAQDLFASGNAGLVLSKLVLRPLLGNSKAGPMGSTRLGPTIQLEQPPLQRHPGDQDDMLEVDAGPGESLLASSQPALEWLLRHPDPSNVVRLQQVLLQQQRRQQRARSGLGDSQAAQLGGEDLLAEAQTTAGEPFVQDGRATHGIADRAPEAVGKPNADSPQPSTAVQPSLPYPRKDRVARNPLQAGVRMADGGESLSQPQSHQLGPGGLAAGGGGRSRTAGREKAVELRSTAEGDGGGFDRRGRKSTEEELFQAADALELLMNSEPGTTGAVCAAGTTRAALANASGLNGGVGRVALSSRAGGSGGPAEAVAPRGEPVVPGRGAAGRGRMGSGGQRGGGGRGTRIGGTGPRIIRGTMPDPDLGDDEEENTGGTWAGRMGPRDSPLYGGGGRAQPGASPYDGPAEGDEGADYEEGRPVPGERNGSYVLDGPVGIAGSDCFDVDFREEDETMFGPVPRRPRTSVYCSPMLYDDIVTGANPPSSEVQVLALSWSEFVRLVHRQHQGRGLAGWNPVAMAEPQHLMQRAHRQSERHRGAEQLPYPLYQSHPANLLGAMGAYQPQAYSQELLRRALLIQQVSGQGIPTAADWNVPRGDGRYGGAGDTAPAPGRRPPGQGATTIPWGPRAPAGAARTPGDWQDVVELRPPLGGVDMEEDIEDELRRRQNVQPPYQEPYDETAAAMAAAAEQQQQLLEHLALLGIGGILDGFPGGLAQALGGGEPTLEYGGVGPSMAFPQRPEQQYPGRLPSDMPVTDLPEEVSAGRKRSVRAGKARPASDTQPPTSDLIPLEEIDVGGATRGSKRMWSKLDGSGAGQYAGGQGPQQLSGYENGGAGLDSDGNALVAVPPPYEAALRTRRGPPLKSSADVLMLQDRTVAGRSSGGGAPPAGAVGGSSRQRAGGSRSRIGSMDNAPDDDVEEMLPSTERAATGAAWHKPSRGGGGVGQQRWHGGAIGEAADVDGGPYRPYAGPDGGSDQYFNSYEQRECSGAVGVVPAGAGAPTPAPISKRQRHAEGALLHGRSGAAGARGRGRNMSPRPPGAPGTLVPTAGPRASATAAAAAAEQRRLLELTYKPYMELRDVQETRDGQQLSLVFGHTTLGTFAGNLKLVTAE